MNKELRTFVAAELRASGSEKEMRVEGYAATFGSVTRIGSFNEVIAPGAFRQSLADNDDVVALVDHDPSKILARRSAGTLTLTEDNKGLRFAAVLPNTSVARDCYENLRAGNLKECSFGFFIDGEAGEEWTRTEDGTPLRTLKSVRLFDVSVVTFPAYGNTNAQARNVVSASAEARSVALTEEDSLALRRLRAQAALDEIAAEDQERADADLLLRAKATSFLL